ncbi:MAG: hypothetical protein HXO72_05085 [Scardovia wiggsiae]|uniref:hypothetical protein n=1 Tax=Scardovia wiggsiae TaxID=230143 RepID=UPI001CB2FD74|nr:hypothetical protein [Scardovia wiggsiae]
MKLTINCPPPGFYIYPKVSGSDNSYRGKYNTPTVTGLQQIPESGQNMGKIRAPYDQIKEKALEY